METKTPSASEALDRIDAENERVKKFAWQRFDGVKKLADCNYSMKYLAIVHGLGAWRLEPLPINVELQAMTLKRVFAAADKIFSHAPSTYFSAEIYRNEGKYFEKDFRKIFDGKPEGEK